jgi:exodeoxyribonuclease V gamma subunit
MKNAREHISSSLPEIIFSNHLEQLVSELKVRLFSSSSLPFQERLVIVPDLILKKYLLHAFAKDPQLNIAAGLRIFTLSQAIDEILTYHFHEHKYKIPSVFELSLSLEVQILELIHCFPKMETAGKELYHPLFTYLEVNQRNLDSKIERRLSTLCDQLAQLFVMYGVYGGAFLEKWLKEPGWKQKLWHLMFSENTQWNYLQKQLDRSSFPALNVHLFNFDFLPQSYQQFFHRLGCTYYLLSPCQLFWGDLCTDKERAFLHKALNSKKIKEKDRQELDKYLKDQNLFLANSGKLARDFLTLLEEHDPCTYDNYVEDSADILLKKIQKDFLVLRSTHLEEKEVFLANDQSIQLHATTSKIREVEVLLDNLLTILDRHSCDAAPIHLNDILVLAPDISEYVPYIHMIFGSTESQLDYVIYDLPAYLQSPFVQGLQHLLSLLDKRFDIVSVLKLFNYSGFLKKFSLSEKDVVRIKKWIHKSYIRWGFDAEQKQNFLANEGKEDKISEEMQSGTWLHGLDRLLFGLAMLLNEDDTIAEMPWPVYEVEFSEAELLGTLIALIQSLKDDLEPIVRGQRLSIVQWIDYLQCLARAYFVLEQEDEMWLGELDRFAGSCRNLTYPLSFKNVFKRIQDHLFLRKKTAFHPSHLGAVRFCSIKNGAVYPARVLCLLGMNEGVYPRSEIKNPLCDPDFPSSSEYYPRQTDKDRWIFLEVLLSARSYFVISYQNIGVEDEKEQSPSVLIQEFMSYLDGAYICEGCNVLPSTLSTKIHPPLPFEASYFQDQEGFKSFSSANYAASLVYSSASFKKKKPFIPEFYEEAGFIKKKDPVQRVFDIRELTKLARHPIQFYLNEVLEIYLKAEEGVPPEEREFILSYLDRAAMRKASMKYDFSSVLKRAESKGQMPIGPFKQIALMSIKEETDDLQHVFSFFELKRKDIFSIELKLGCFAPLQMPSGNWILPAIDVPLKSGGTAKVVGKLADLSMKGLIYHGKDDLKDLVKAWPLFLIFVNLPDFGVSCQHQLLLSKEGKAKKFELENPLSFLSDYLAYAELCCQNISPLMPDWAKAILQGEVEDLRKSIHSSKGSNFSDEYLDWLFAKDPEPLASMICKNWSHYLRNIFSPLFKDCQNSTPLNHSNIEKQ